MSEPEMIERVARAICAGTLPPEDAHRVDTPVEHMGDIVLPYWKNFERAARGAIAAMREPTEAMCSVNCEPVPTSGTDNYRKGERQRFRRYWQRMIDRALAD